MKLQKFLLLVICALLNTSCTLSTGDFDWKNIYSFDFDNLNFAQTTPRDMTNECPKFVPVNTQTDYFLMSSNPQRNFSAIRAGFSTDTSTLEWIEFILKEEKTLNDFISIYGTPVSVDTTYDTNVDYYEFENFKLCTDKGGEKVYSMIFYSKPEIPEKIQNLYKILPTLNNLNISPNLRPGTTLETEFTNSFPNIIADKVHGETRVYTIGENLAKDYKKVELIFGNGILSFINLFPKDMQLTSITEIYGQPKAIEHIPPLKFYEYANFIVTLDEKNNIISIGIFDSWANYATNK